MRIQNPLPCLTDIQKERLFTRFKQTENGCWEWQASKNNDGYGLLRIKRTYYLAHRLMYHIQHKVDPKTSKVRHSCDNPPCVNPEHLLLGTQADNVADMIARGRQNNLYGENHANAKLTLLQVEEIRKRRATGESAPRIGADFGVSSTTVYYIAKGATWKH